MSKPFNPSEERPIPTLPDPPPTKEVREYVIGMQMVSGRIRFYFVNRPKAPDPSADGPLDIRVPSDCLIVLRLDNAFAWEFRHDNAIMFGPMNYPDFVRYCNLVPEIVNGRCQKVQFNARYLDVEEANRDPYAFYVLLDQQLSGAPLAEPLLVRIDPDIIDPGDHK